MLAIGVDIGGTKTAAGLVDDSGRIIEQHRFDTDPGRGVDDFLDRLLLPVELLIERAGSRSYISGIGIGCPGPLDPVAGVITSDFTLPSWAGRNIVRPLREVLKLPVFLENDADAALIGECRAGAARGARDAVMLTFGTGVGGAALCGGRILRGANDEHPEIGHIPALADGPACYCGLNGCLESIASGTAIGAAHESNDARTVFQLADKSDERATAILDNVTRAIETSLWTLTHTYVPEVIILGGGVMDQHYPRFAPALLASLDRIKLHPKPRLTPATLGNTAGLIGAAFLATPATS